jgi:hypothetical protein
MPLVFRAWVGGAGRSRVVSSSAVRRHRAIWPSSRVTPLTNRRDSSEQAYVPAEQPPPPQGARIPAAHAHPRGAFHPVRASPQGPQESRRLSPRGSSGPCLPRPCYRRSIASPAVTTCDVCRAADDAAAATPWWCTCSSGLHRTPTRGRHGSGSWSARSSATPSPVIVSNAGSAICAGTASRICRGAARSSSGLSPRRPERRTRNSGRTSTVVSTGCSATVRSAGRGV